MMIEGGIRSPSVPAPASVPIVMSSGYPRRASSGSVILPIVAHVAAELPDTAAKIVQPMMFVCSSRPGTRSSHGARPRNMSSDNRVRKRISPIHTKSGSAVRVHDDALPQIVTAIASPAAGCFEKNSIPIHATPVSASPIQTPLPSSANSARTRSSVTTASMRAGYSLRSASAGARAARRPVHSSTSSSTSAMNRVTVPAAMASCGIHNGVASFAVEMSLKSHDCQASRTLK